jgi:hypothetical protein
VRHRCSYLLGHEEERTPLLTRYLVLVFKHGEGAGLGCRCAGFGPTVDGSVVCALLWYRCARFRSQVQISPDLACCLWQFAAVANAALEYYDVLYDECVSWSRTIEAAPPQDIGTHSQSLITCLNAHNGRYARSSGTQAVVVVKCSGSGLPSDVDQLVQALTGHIHILTGT